MIPRIAWLVVGLVGPTVMKWAWDHILETPKYWEELGKVYEQESKEYGDLLDSLKKAKGAQEIEAFKAKIRNCTGMHHELVEKEILAPARKRMRELQAAGIETYAQYMEAKLKGRI